MPYNTEQELKGRLQFLSNRDAWELTEILETAHRRVKSKYGRYIQERLYQEVEDQEEFDLSFSDLFEIKKVYYNDKVVDDSNYTADIKEGTITFIQAYANENIKLGHDYRLIVFYVPKVFKDLELYYAMQEIVSMNMVETNDQQETNRLDQLNRTIKKVESDIIKSMPRYSKR